MTSFPKSSADIITEIADHLIQSRATPDTPRPTLADLEPWHQDGKCPLEARVETERRLKLLLLDQITWSPRDKPVILYQLSQDGNIKWSSTPLGPVTWALETTIAELYEEWRKRFQKTNAHRPHYPLLFGPGLIGLKKSSLNEDPGAFYPGTSRTVPPSCQDSMLLANPPHNLVWLRHRHLQWHICPALSLTLRLCLPCSGCMTGCRG